MKSLFFAALMMCTASVAFAQNENYRKFYASFNTGETRINGVGMVSNASIREQLGGVRKLGSIGANIGFAYAFNLKKTNPLFLEVGSELGYFEGAENTKVNGNDQKVNITMMNFQIPLNVTYHICVFKNFTIAPYAGINFKFNILGKLDKENKSYDMFKDGEMKMIAKALTSSNLPHRLNQTLPEELDGSFYDGKARRFQFGLNLGVNLILSDKFFLGYRYQPDLTNYYKYKRTISGRSGGIKFTSTNHYITLGTIF